MAKAKNNKGKGSHNESAQSRAQNRETENNTDRGAQNNNAENRQGR